MKTRKWVSWMLVLGSFVMMGSNGVAETPSSYGPKSKRFGVGLHLGEPTGFTVKGYLTRRLGLDGIAAWSFTEDAFTLIGDVTYKFLDIPVDSNTVTLPFYAGAGFKLGVDAGPGDDTIFAVRVPVGLAVQWVKHPIEIFFELAPGVAMAPDTDFDLTGGIGARFYF